MNETFHSPPPPFPQSKNPSKNWEKYAPHREKQIPNTLGTLRTPQKYAKGQIKHFKHTSSIQAHIPPQSHDQQGAKFQCDQKLPRACTHPPATDPIINSKLLRPSCRNEFLFK